MGSSYMPARRMLPWILNNSVLALSKRQVNLIHLDTMKAYKVKLKCTPLQALRLCTGRTAHRGSRGIDLLFHDNGTRRGEGSASRPGRFLPRERPGIHCTGGWVGPRAGLDRCGESRPPPGFDPRTVQPVASRCTEYATRPTWRHIVFWIYCTNYCLSRQ